jgi:predicted nucleic acid-binding protein
VIVADTSLIANLLIPGLDQQMAERVIHRDAAWVAPALWRSEFASTLLKYVRAGAFELDDAIEHLQKAESLILTDVVVDYHDVLGTAVASGASTYDCEYVIASRKLGVRLVTADRRLAARFPQIAVLIADFASN